MVLLDAHDTIVRDEMDMSKEIEDVFKSKKMNKFVGGSKATNDSPPIIHRSEIQTKTRRPIIKDLKIILDVIDHSSGRKSKKSKPIDRDSLKKQRTSY